MYQRSPISSKASPDRAVTEVLGAILVFGLVLAVLALVQVSAIPVANGQVEFEHSQRVAGDFQALDQNVDAAGTRGSLGSTSVEAGVRYPNRLFFINPGPVGGSLLSDSGSVSLTGFTGTSADEANDYDLASSPFPTTGFRYSADYNEYANAPTVHYENGVLFERYENADGTVQDIVVDGGSLVSGRRITIVTVEGDFSTQVPDRIPINVVSVSAGTRAVTVDAGSNSQITVDTILSENTWNEILGSEIASGQVEAVACPGQGNPALPCNGPLNIDLADGVYNLRMAKVGLTANDNQNPAADFSEEGARYIVAESSTSTSAVSDQSVELVAEVRDRFNNPVSGEPVTFSVVGTNAQLVSDSTPQTNVDGLASVLVDTGGASSAITVTAQLGSGSPSDEDQYVTFTVSIVDADGGDQTAPEDTLSTINDADAPVFFSDVSLKNTVETPQQGEDSGLPDTFRVEMINRGSTTHTITQARISFLLADETALYANVVDKDNGNATLGRLYLTDSFVPIGPIELSPDETRTIDLVFYEFETEAEVPGNADWEANLVGQNGKTDTFATVSIVVDSDVVGQADDETTRQTSFVAVSEVTPLAFLGATAENVVESQDNQDQNITFTLGRGLNAGETVTINLSDATDQVDYDNANGFTADIAGDVTYDSGTDTITFVATGNGVPGGTTVTITVDSVEVGTVPASFNPATIEITRSDVIGTQTTEFNVS